MSAGLSIGTAWAETAAFVRRERRLVAPVVLGLIMVPAAIAAMVQPPAPPGARPEPGSWMVIAFVMIVAMIVGQLTIALLANGWRARVGEAIGRAARRLPTLILAGLAVIVPLFLFLTFAFALAGVAGGAGGAAIGSPNLGSAGALAVVIFILALLFVMVRLLPLIAIVANGSDGAIASLKRSFQLTRGHFWKLLGFVLLMTIAFMIVTVAVSTVVGSLLSLTLGRPEPWSVSLLLIALVGGAIQAGFATVYTAMLTRIAVQLEGASTSGT